MSYFSKVVGVYCFLHKCAQRSWGIFSHRHQILALRTLLRVVGSRKPRLPTCFGLQTFC
jgi:hypothetical protein